MRAVLTSAALAASLAACSLGSAPPRAPQPDMPLRAWIQPHQSGFGFGDLQFYVNRPAYVAMFEIVPGRGIGLVHPLVGSDEGARKLSHAGYNRIWTGLGTYRWAYSSPNPGFGYYGSYSYPQPRYYLLVASDEPLRIRDIVGSPTALRSMLGPARFAAFDPYDLMEDVTHMILRRQNASNWDTDVYVDWPEPRPLLRTAQVDYRILQCDDGTRIVISRRSNATACPQDIVVEPGDSTNIEKPVRKRPRPTSAGPAQVVGTGLDTSPITRPEVIRIRPDGPARRPEITEEEGVRAEPRPLPRPVPVTRPEAPRAESPRADSPRDRSPRVERPRSSSPRVEKPSSRSPRAERPRSSPRVERPRSSPPKPRATPRSSPPPKPRPAPRPTRPTRDRSDDEPSVR